MSRTYRKLRHWQCSEQEYLYINMGILYGKKRHLTKKEFARARRDGYLWEPHRYYHHQVHVKRRNNDRIEFSKVYRCDDFEDYDFDDSPAVMKRRGVWWDIY